MRVTVWERAGLIEITGTVGHGLMWEGCGTRARPEVWTRVAIRGKASGFCIKSS